MKEGVKVGQIMMIGRVGKKIKVNTSCNCKTLCFLFYSLFLTNMIKNKNKMK